MNDTIPFLNYFNELDDPRHGIKVLYPLEEILLLCLCGVIAGAESFTGITDYGREKLDFLRGLLPFERGIPAHDTLNDLFRRLDIKTFEACFQGWSQSLSESVPGLVAIDGKTLRGSRDGAKKPLHMVSAWACEQKLILGQVKTAEKSNEITAIPELLDMLVLKGAVVSIDAMGCQKSITGKIIEREADYILALKGNHGDLHDDVKTFFESEAGKAFPVLETNDADHGRVETRRYRLCDNVEWLNARNPGWNSLRGIGMVESLVCEKGKNKPQTRQVRFYITSIAPDLKLFARGVRGHWGIENSLHWVLDVSFDEDRCRVRKDNAPHIFSIFKRCAINLINKNKGKSSIKSIRRRAGWGNNTMLRILAS